MASICARCIGLSRSRAQNVKSALSLLRLATSTVHVESANSQPRIVIVRVALLGSAVASRLAGSSASEPSRSFMICIAHVLSDCQWSMWLAPMRSSTYICTRPWMRAEMHTRRTRTTTWKANGMPVQPKVPWIQINTRPHMMLVVSQ